MAQNKFGLNDVICTRLQEHKIPVIDYVSSAGVTFLSGVNLLQWLIINLFAV